MKSYTLIRQGALLSLLGFILSGPVSVVIVMLVSPQPEWHAVETFVREYHPIQTLPYYFGFFLLAGLLMLNTGLLLSYKDNPDPVRAHTWIGYALALVFICLVSINYICQTTFVPHLIEPYDHANASLIAGFSMTNPNSLSWAIEMWGYAFLGASNWFMATCYRKQNKLVSFLLKLNFIVSLGSLIWAILDANWVNTSLGLILFFAWNVLMMLIVVLIYRHPHTSVN